MQPQTQQAAHTEQGADLVQTMTRHSSDGTQRSSFSFGSPSSSFMHSSPPVALFASPNAAVAAAAARREPFPTVFNYICLS
eukprot:m.162752 g.162752  ORF g.162752 m.162752 type:complete len:81 (+) comp17097_c1_seq4:436-678(+)